jgi:hypothetical protein
MNTTTFLNEINKTFNDFFETLKYNDLRNEADGIRFELNEFINDTIKEICDPCSCYDKKDSMKYFKYKVVAHIFNKDEIISNYYIETGKYRKINEIINEYLKTTLLEDQEDISKTIEKHRDRTKSLF